MDEPVTAKGGTRDSNTPASTAGKSYDWIADRAAELGRSCLNCSSLCCKLLQINEPSIAKPRDVWCRHCEPGGVGCKIYRRRPNICREWACGYLVNGGWAEHWNPDQSKMVINPWCEHYPTETDGPATLLHIDPDHVGIWRTEPWHSDLLERLGRGDRIFIVEAGQHYELVQEVVSTPEIEAGMRALLDIVLAEAAEAAEGATATD
jgi:hypothetical protein